MLCCFSVQLYIHEIFTIQCSWLKSYTRYWKFGIIKHSLSQRIQEFSVSQKINSQMSNYVHHERKRHSDRTTKSQCSSLNEWEDYIPTPASWSLRGDSNDRMLNLICSWGRDLWADHDFQFLLNRMALSFGNWKRWCFHFTLWHLLSIVSKAKCSEESIDCSLFILLWLGVSNSNHIRSFITLRKSLDKPGD